MMSRRYKIASVLWTAMTLMLLEPRSSAQTSVPVSTSTPESNVSSPSRNQNLEWALNYAQACLAYSNENIHDYTAILTKRCRENGVLSESQHILVKIRHRREEAGRKTVPMSVYMTFLKPDGVKGREECTYSEFSPQRLDGHAWATLPGYRGRNEEIDREDVGEGNA